MERVEQFLDDQVSRRPDGPALIGASGTCWSYADLSKAADGLVSVLDSEGCRPGDRVVLIAENCCATIAGLFACWRAGVWAVPVNARQSPREIDRILDHARPRVAIATSVISPDAAAHAARLNAKETTGAFGTLSLATPFDSSPEADHDVAVVLYTTGTTGDPKGVMLSHANLRTGARTSARFREMAPEDLIYGTLPVSHVFGLASTIVASVSVGAAVRLEHRFTAARLHDALQAGVTMLPAVPQMHALLMQYAKEHGVARLQGRALRYVSSGGAPLDPAWKHKAENFYGIALQNGYGMTETTAGICITSNVLGDPDNSVGRPLPGVEVRIEGETGEILTRGGHVMKGYYRDPAATAQVLDSDGWLHTGDLGRLDSRGRVHVLGRSKELIIHGGFNVYPPEVEAVLTDHPQVVQSAVIGRPRDGDEDVLAFVQIAKGDALSPDALRAFVADRLAGYKRPAQYIITTRLPAAATGKILKHQLLDAFADQLS